jgi:hypothetical protein
METSPPRNSERLDDLRSVVVLLLQSGVLRPGGDRPLDAGP